MFQLSVTHICVHGARFKAAHIFKLFSDASLFIYFSKMPSVKPHLQPFKALNVIFQLDFILFRYEF